MKTKKETNSFLNSPDEWLCASDWSKEVQILQNKEKSAREKEEEDITLQNEWKRDTIIHLEGILPLQETMGERADIRKEITRLKLEINSQWSP